VLPLGRLDDDVDGAELELRHAQLEAHRVQLRPRDPRFVRGQVLADPTVARDEVEAELPDVPRLDLAHAARDEVVVEEVHGPQDRRTPAEPVEASVLARWASTTSISSSPRSSAASRSTASCSRRSGGTA